MNDMLSMQVSAILNITQKDLQTQLNTIRQQINETPLEIKINIDKTILSDLKEFTKAVKDINIADTCIDSISFIIYHFFL